MTPPAGATARALAPADVAEAARRISALPAGRLPNEHEARQALAACGIDGPREALVATPEEAAQAAARLGYPVAVKGMAEGVPHKTEAGLVRLGLRSGDEVRAAAADVVAIAARLAPGRPCPILVAEMVRPVAELLVGARVDPDFGPVVVAGAGGILVELYRDVAIRLAPVSEAAALEMLRATRAAALLAGWRGRPRGDAVAAARAVAALSELIADRREQIAEVEINPLAVLEEGGGVRALDCLLVPRALAARADRAPGGGAPA
jgi:succinyl-CoA synthetase beta subunit